MISVVIPTLNEEKALPATLSSLLAQTGCYEVIVVDGDSEDATIEILNARRGVKWFRAPRGRASQMNAGAAAAAGRMLLFLHADTRLPDDGIRRLNQMENDHACRAGGFHQRFSGKAWPLRVVSWLHNRRCRRTGVFYGDQAMFVRRTLFRELGGFPADSILEDIRLSEKIREQTRPVFLEQYVTTDSRKFEQMGAWRSLARCIAIVVCHRMRLPIPARKFFAPVR